jgi:hypothetical protein
MTWRQSEQVALIAALLAVLLMLYMQLEYYFGHSPG